ncbi:VOC family protein [Rubellimicrobium arenae]|uniref:VOC family protein n=1 Tax=Rubellimicrobium arenae TaxID=2817372 RepID=UPI001B316159|nr:VOC family protein [Rubellimicrobium arenae]
MSTASAPLEIGRVALTVNDLAGTGSFYQRALGLERLGGDGGVALYGAGDRRLLELREDRSARRRSPREAGLFHTAFLLPSRKALGRWLLHAAGTKVPVQGASDHLVSEAIYLSDPEGNGIEIYADRPRDAWPREGNSIRMSTDPLDLQNLAEAADGPWTGAPEGTVVGHVHLQVGAVPEAEAFYHDTLGFDIVTHYPGASFLGSGGYHHHLGANTWNSRGAARRTYPSTGLADLEILAEGPALEAILLRTGGTRHVADPWGTSITLTRKEA